MVASFPVAEERGEWESRLWGAVKSSRLDDRWPQESMECGASTSDRDGFRACVAALTEAQQRGYKTRVDAVVEAMRADTPLAGY